jgi:hypothetical protein
MVPQGEGIAEATAGVRIGGALDNDNTKRRSALKTALIEFALVFVIAFCWNHFRKTSESLVDTAGVAALTAFFLFLFHRSK